MPALGNFIEQIEKQSEEEKKEICEWYSRFIIFNLAVRANSMQSYNFNRPNTTMISKTTFWRRRKPQFAPPGSLNTFSVYFQCNASKNPPKLG